MEYTSDGISRIRFGNTDYSIKDEPLRNSFVRLSNIIKENNREIQEYMESNSMDTAYMTYNLNNATSFLYAFSEVCVNQISKLNNDFSDLAYFSNLTYSVLLDRVNNIENQTPSLRNFTDLYTYTIDNVGSINSRTSYATTTREGVVQLSGISTIIDEMGYRNDAMAVTPGGLATALSYKIGDIMSQFIWIGPKSQYDAINPKDSDKLYFITEY